MSKISELWNKGQLPTKGGVYFANGESFSSFANFHPNIFIKKESHLILLIFYINILTI